MNAHIVALRLSYLYASIEPSAIHTVAGSSKFKVQSPSLLHHILVLLCACVVLFHLTGAPPSFHCPLLMVAHSIALLGSHRRDHDSASSRPKGTEMQENEAKNWREINYLRSQLVEG